MVITRVGRRFGRGLLSVLGGVLLGYNTSAQSNDIARLNESSVGWLSDYVWRMGMPVQVYGPEPKPGRLVTEVIDGRRHNLWVLEKKDGKKVLMVDKYSQDGKRVRKFLDDFATPGLESVGDGDLNKDSLDYDIKMGEATERDYLDFMSTVQEVISNLKEEERKNNKGEQETEKKQRRKKMRKINPKELPLGYALA